MKVIISSSRYYSNRDAVFAALDKAHAKRPISMVIHGGSGAGILAESWANERGLLSARLVSGDVLACDPDWLIAFAGASVDFVEKARQAGVRVCWPDVV